jgi:hypothetical protein
MLTITKVALGIVLGVFVIGLLNNRGTRGCGFIVLVILVLVLWNVGC